MRKHLLLTCVLTAACGFATACEEDSANTNSNQGASNTGNTGAGAGTGTTMGAGSGDGTGATAGGNTGSGVSGSGSTGGDMPQGGGAAMCVNTGDDNLDCPVAVGPETGDCAPKGACCHRASNNAKLAQLGPNDPGVLEYRLNLFKVTNHPRSISLPVLLGAAAMRADTCAGEQCLLWRFTKPRENGAFVAGPGMVEIGIGAYNCDGTYSFYGPTAAPPRDGISTDPARWEPGRSAVTFDPSQSGRASYTIPFAEASNREVSRSVFLNPADNTIDWELQSMGFEITSLDTSEAGNDCMGSRAGAEWVTGGTAVSYSPLVGNDVDINDLISQTYCQLLAFGILPEGMKDLSCIDTPRCMPTPDVDPSDPSYCKWVKLPDSLCPMDDTERGIFGCHLGAQGNPNAEEGYPETLNCTMEAPTSPLDPAQGATSEGQCCDPLGQSDTLPACNAYRVTAEYVAAAAEITDAPLNGLPPVCN